MKIIIVGAGQVGTNLASKLGVQEGHDITVVDRNMERIVELSHTMDVQTVCASISPLSLVQADIDKCDMLIAVTNIDEINLISCQIAKKYGVEHTIARVNNVDYEDRFSILRCQDFGADFIFNQMAFTRDEIVRLVQTPGATDIAFFSENRVELVGFHITEQSLLSGQQLMDIRKLTALQDHLVVAIRRQGKTIIPDGKTDIKQDDTIYIIGRTDTVSNVSPLIGNFSQKIKKIMIFGANELTIQITRELEKMGSRVVLIAPDKKKGYQIKGRLPQTLVLIGIGSDMDLQKEEGIAYTDVFIAVSDNEDANLLASLTAKKNGAGRVMAMVQNPQYFPITEAIGIDVLISPKISTEGSILKYVRKGKVYNVASVKGTNAEVLEIEAEEGSPITGGRIMDLNLPDGIILGGIVRGKEVIIPDGNLQVQANDRVILFHLPMDTEVLSAWFATVSQ